MSTGLEEAISDTLRQVPQIRGDVNRRKVTDASGPRTLHQVLLFGSRGGLVGELDGNGTARDERRSLCSIEERTSADECICSEEGILKCESRDLMRAFIDELHSVAGQIADGE